MSDLIRQRLLDQVAGELAQRASKDPSMEFDRLRARQPDILRILGERESLAFQAAKKAREDADAMMNSESGQAASQAAKDANEWAIAVAEYAAELHEINNEIRATYPDMEKRHAAWTAAGEGAQLWSPTAVALSGALYRDAMMLRGEVVRRLPETDDEPYRSIRKAVQVGVDVGKNAPLQVYDLANAQVMALENKDNAAVLEARGVKVFPHLRRIKPALAKLEVERKTGVGTKKGKARQDRDEQQKRLEILLSRAISVVAAALDPDAAEAVEALLPRTSGRRSADQPVTPPVPETTLSSPTVVVGGEKVEG